MPTAKENVRYVCVPCKHMSISKFNIITPVKAWFPCYKEGIQVATRKT